jgi:hypothetical protein
MFGALTLFFTPPAQTALWIISLLCELWIVAGFSLLCVLTFKQVMTALSAAMAFYLLARSVSALQAIGSNAHADHSLSQQVIDVVINVIASLMPHLDQFTKTEWLVYQTGSWHAMGMILLQSALFLAVLSGASLFDLYRKNI